MVATFTYYADLCAAGTGLLPQGVALPDAGFSATQEQVPVGVAGLIVPWNFPMVTTAWKLAPALAASWAHGACKPSRKYAKPSRRVEDLLYFQ